MGKEYFKRAVGTAGGVTVPTESLTGTDAAQTVAVEGVTLVTVGTSNQSNDFILPDPRPGVVKVIAVNNNTTSDEFNLNTNATANTFFGTTFNTISPGTTDATSPAGAIVLVGASTSQWAVVAASSDVWALTATTGSTATA